MSKIDQVDCQSDILDGQEVCICQRRQAEYPCTCNVGLMWLELDYVRIMNMHSEIKCQTLLLNVFTSYKHNIW